MGVGAKDKVKYSFTSVGEVMLVMHSLEGKQTR